MSARICSQPDCSRPHQARGLCSKHYSRWARLGTPDLTPFSREAAFWAKVNKTDTCWQWTGAKTRGWGSFSFGGRQSGAHRFAYELLVGPIPEGFQVDHLCHNRACVNPEHLEAVTPYVNNMRSNSVSAVNARRSHCAKGHPYTPDNTRVSKDGARRCRTCHEHWRQVGLARRKTQRTCVECGAQFSSARSDVQRCSPSCAASRPRCRTVVPA